jgi:hypothetical protein
LCPTWARDCAKRVSLDFLQKLSGQFRRAVQIARVQFESREVSTGTLSSLAMSSHRERPRF